MSVDQIPQLKRVEWLVKVLDLDSRKQAYAAITDGRIPQNCVIRVGRYLRVNPDAVARWINGELKATSD